MELLTLAGQIKTFTERMDDEASIAKIRDLVKNAEMVVFLGFAFHRQNMNLIQPPKPSNAKLLLATAKGVSDNDCEVINIRLLDLFNSKPQKIQVHIRNQLNCHGLFREYQRSISLS